MNDLDSKIAEEIDDEALFRLAEGEEHEFSPSYNKAMENLYHKAAAHPKRKSGPIRRIIVIAAVIVILTGAATAATFWDEIQQFFVLNFGQYVELQTDWEREIRQEVFAVVPEEWDSFWYPNLENGCSIVSARTTGDCKVIVFQSNETELKLYQWEGKRSVNADNDAEIVLGIFVGDKEAFATEREQDGITYRTLLWTEKDMSFRLYGPSAFDELSKIAGSLILIER